ncbi:zf-HC2 domain-containing protein [Nocardioides sp.]|uniref:anti-sigma factor family protein n=1 Tax=Nocardioides sp. TaxID=35761 RepID=UPI00286AFAEB|nr:zf-HC2 domain-containing protein [Nocardioides sp.]
MSCDQRRLDGAYVLGALAPHERQAFEEHLVGCAGCAGSVQDLAGLPGLLGHVDVSLLAETEEAGPPPVTLLPALLLGVRRAERRRRLLTVATTSAATLALVGAALFGSGRLGTADEVVTPPAAQQPVAPGRSMRALVGSPVSAELSLEQVLWGTRLALVCSYLADDYSAGPTTYALFVVTRDGRREQVATWRALPGRTMTLAAATASDVDDIVAIVVRRGSRAVLELDT